MTEDTSTVANAEEISFDDYDELVNPRSDTCDFDDIVEAAISRRGFMGGVLAFGGASLLAGTSSLISPEQAMAAPNRFGFKPVTANTNDTITVP